MKPGWLSLCLLFFIPAAASAQTGWGSVYRFIDATPYRGKNFTLQAAVKVQALDTAAAAMLWLRVDAADKNMLGYYNTKNNPARANEWRTYTLTGKIDKLAGRLFFGGQYSKQGRFWFDQFRLQIEGKNHVMEEVPLPEAGFEGDSVAIVNAWSRIFTEKAQGAVHSITTENPFAGQKSFLADATHLIYEPDYGNNESAGGYITVGNIKMYYEIYGQGEPLLLLHGNSASIRSYKYQIPALSKKYRVIALDSRAQGRSSEDGTRFTYELFAADTKAFLDQLHLDSVHIVGWSDGGNIGLIMAMKYPQKVKSLVTMGANLYNNDSSVKPYVIKYLHNWSARLSDTAAADIFRKRMNDLLLNEPNISPGDLAAIKCPVLVTAGHDDLIKEEHTRLIATSIKNGRLLIFPPGSTHDEPSERPWEFNKAVLDFLGTVNNSAAAGAAAK